MTIITINRSTNAQPHPTNSTRTANKSFNQPGELNLTPSRTIQENTKTKPTQESFHSIDPIVINSHYQETPRSQHQLTNYSLSYAIQAYHEHNNFEQKENIQQLLGVDVFV